MNKILFKPIFLLFQARFIAFHPITHNGYPSLRLELYGCQLSNKSSIISTVIAKDIEVCGPSALRRSVFNIRIERLVLCLLNYLLHMKVKTLTRLCNLA